MLTAFLLWNSIVGVSLVVQWFRPCLPAQWVWAPSLVRELRSPMPPGQKVKSSNRSNNVTNYIKTLKTVHIRKKKKNPLKKEWNGILVMEKNKHSWEVTGGLVFRILGHFGVRVQSLAWKLRSCKLHGTAKKKKKLLSVKDTYWNVWYLLIDWLTHTSDKFLGLPSWLRQ